MKWSKKQLETILGRKLLDFEYEFIDKYIIHKEKNKKLDVYFGRQNGRTKLITDADLIYGLKAKTIIVDEVNSTKESE